MWETRFKVDNQECYNTIYTQSLKNIFVIFAFFGEMKDNYCKLCPSPVYA